MNHTTREGSHVTFNKNQCSWPRTILLVWGWGFFEGATQAFFELQTSWRTRIWIIFVWAFFTGCPVAPIKKPLIHQPFLTARLELLLNLSPRPPIFSAPIKQHWTTQSSSNHKMGSIFKLSSPIAYLFSFHMFSTRELNNYLIKSSTYSSLTGVERSNSIHGEQVCRRCY